MNERDYEALLANLRRAVPDFALFEAVQLNDFTQVELAESTDKCVQTINRRIRRVKEALRQYLPPDLPVVGDSGEGIPAYFD